METGSLELEDGAEVVFYNVEAGMFMTGGTKISAPWATQTSLTSTNPVTFKVVFNEEDETWTINTASGGNSGKPIVAPNATGDQPYCYIDGQPRGSGQGGNDWYVDGDAEDGYTFDLVQDDLAPDGTYLGAPSEGNLNVVFNANPDEGGLIYWKFIAPEEAAVIGPKIQIYKIRCELYELGTSDEVPESVDMTPYNNVYNNPDATYEELVAALGKLKAAILEEQMKEEAGDASIENPIDITGSVIVNPTFDVDVSGWDAVENGMDHSPVGASYTNGDSSISDFCEKWTWAKSHDRAYGISQTFNLPAGLYRVEVDALATCQQDQSITVSGVKFYVKNEGNYEVAVATANNAPKHYGIYFVNDGSTPVTIGFGCEASTEANWIAVDNFVLYNCGKSENGTAFFNLYNVVSSAENLYPEDEMDGLEANSAVKDAYMKALEAAQTALNATSSTDAQFEEAQKAFEAAVADLTNSVADYKSLRSTENGFSSLSGALLDLDDDEGSMETTVSQIAAEIGTMVDEAQCGKAEADQYAALYSAYNDLLALFTYTSEQKEANEGSDDLIAMIEQKEKEMFEMWVNGASSLTREQVAAKKSEISDMIGKFNRVDIEPGDISDMIVNNSFDENVEGWDNVGGMSHDPNGTVYTNGDSQIAGFCEKWTPAPNKLGNAYRISQTLYLPSGLYRLEADAIASQQGDANTVVQGVKLYVKNSKDYEVAVSTASEKPVHYSIDFMNDESKGTEIGFGCEASTTANWIAVDNFKLTFIGNSAEDFADMVQYLVSEIEEMLEEGYPTADVVGKFETAKADAENAIKANNAQGCLDAIEDLKALKNDIAPALAATSNLSFNYEYIVNALEDIETSGKTAYEDYLNEIVDKLANAGLKDAEEVSAVIDEMFAKFTECVQSDATSVTEDEPYDMTAAIVNPNYECYFAYENELYDSEYNAFGWQGNPGVNGEVGVAEYWNATWSNPVNCYQTIKGLAPGYYKLYVYGYNRQGHGSDHAGKLDSWGTVYAGTYETMLCDLLDGKQEEPLAGSQEEEVVIDDVTYYYPSMMPSSRAYFDDGIYRNMLVFKVEEGQKEITIGVKKENWTDSWDSLAFDEWSLFYVGTTQPTEQSTTEVDTIAIDNIRSTKYYTLNGVEMSKPVKGVNIIKRTDSNGRVNVSKIMVK